MLRMIKDDCIRTILEFRNVQSIPEHKLYGSRVRMKKEGRAFNCLGYLISATGHPDIALDDPIIVEGDWGGTIHHSWSVETLDQLEFLNEEKKKFRPINIEIPVCPFCGKLLSYYCKDGHDFGFEKKCSCEAEIY